MARIFIGNQVSAFIADQAGTTYILKAGDLVQSADPLAIDATALAANRTIRINGTVEYDQAGIEIGNASPANRVIIGQSGLLDGVNRAVQIAGDDARAINHGTISVDSGSALRVIGDNALLVNDGKIHATTGLFADGDNSRLVNDGLITSQYGLWVDTGFGESALMINNGKITGANAAINGGNGSDKLINTGQINGNINLGFGNDVIDNRGDISGVVNGGWGNDTYIVKHGHYDIEEGLGGGNDTIKTIYDVDTSDLEIENVLLSGRNDLTITGNESDQSLRGNAGRNIIDGNGGDDTITGGKGNDILTGGMGWDHFVFATGCGRDVITDFSILSVNEILDLSGLEGIAGFDDLIANHVKVRGADVIIVDGSDRIVLKNVDVTELGESEFNF